MSYNLRAHLGARASLGPRAFRPHLVRTKRKHCPQPFVVLL